MGLLPYPECTYRTEDIDDTTLALYCLQLHAQGAHPVTTPAAASAQILHYQINIHKFNAPQVLFKPQQHFSLLILDLEGANNGELPKFRIIFMLSLVWLKTNNSITEF